MTEEEGVETDEAKLPRTEEGGDIGSTNKARKTRKEVSEDEMMQLRSEGDEKRTRTRT